MEHSGYAKLLGGVLNEEANDLLNNEAEDLGPLTTKHLLSWAYQIAKGMEYLGSMKVIKKARYAFFVCYKPDDKVRSTLSGIIMSCLCSVHIHIRKSTQSQFYSHCRFYMETSLPGIFS